MNLYCFDFSWRLASALSTEKLPHKPCQSRSPTATSQSLRCKPKLNTRKLKSQDTDPIAVTSMQTGSRQLVQPQETVSCRIQVEMPPRTNMVDAEAQADPDPSPPPAKLEAKEADVKHDHSYSKKLKQQNDHGNTNEVPAGQDLSLETERVSSSTPVKKNAEEDVPCCMQEMDDDELDLKLLEETDLLDPKDTSFHCSDWSDSSLDESFEENVSKPAEERKFIIFESNLDLLVMRLRCPTCGKPQYHVEKFVVGTMLKMKVECLDGHTIIVGIPGQYSGKCQQETFCAVQQQCLVRKRFSTSRT